MPKGYWIARVDVHDADAYAAYIKANAEPLRKHGGRFLVRAGRMHCPEGSARQRNIVVEFQSYQAAHDCWYSPEYQQAIRFRAPCSTGDFIIIEGYDAPE